MAYKRRPYWVVDGVVYFDATKARQALTGSQ